MQAHHCIMQQRGALIRRLSYFSHMECKGGLLLFINFAANPFLTNDDCQTALDVARAKGFTYVVHTIEGHICSFSGHIREILAPGFLDVLVSQLLSRKVWAVVIPNGPQNPSKPPKLELVIYQSTQVIDTNSKLPLRVTSSSFGSSTTLAKGLLGLLFLNCRGILELQHHQLGPLPQRPILTFMLLLAITNQLCPQRQLPSKPLQPMAQIAGVTLLIQPDTTNGSHPLNLHLLPLAPVAGSMNQLNLTTMAGMYRTQRHKLPANLHQRLSWLRLILHPLQL